MNTERAGSAGFVRTKRRGARGRAVVAALGLSALAVLGSGCNNAGEGALSGAALGALGGLAIGSLTGSAGAGAAIGAVAGGIGGAVIGDQNERNARYAEPEPRSRHGW
ncbi:MAG TPA: glycine zipper domain-containing protein [Phycisphaerales bacterium]|nr:glycine zipper domain-containing protein [Phycisphaerales bacterium]